MDYNLEYYRLHYQRLCVAVALALGATYAEVDKMEIRDVYALAKELGIEAADI